MNLPPQDGRGNILTTVGTEGSTGASFVAHSDDNAEKVLLFKVENPTSDPVGSAYSNFLLFSGVLGGNAQLDMSAAFPNYKFTLPDVLDVIRIGTQQIAFSGEAPGNTEGAYSQLQAYYRHVDAKMAKLTIRTNKEQNIQGNRILCWEKGVDQEAEIVKKINLSTGYVAAANDNQVSFEHEIEDLNFLWMGRKHWMVLQNLAYESWMEFELSIPFTSQSTMLKAVR
ncbi:MAG: hypothetical protein HRU12_21690 [Phaeodactylibacter sp.]|nr:hypothetical protein [Phaeodactylibacter sp.]